MTAHVVMFSGGIGSWAAAKRVAEQHGTDDLVLLFTDTKIEDADLYRFLAEAAANVGGTLVRIAEGRTPWEVFRDERMIGNTRADLCSRVLKREMADRWLAANCDPGSTVVYVGVDWSEEHRYRRLRERRAEQGWRYEAPMCGPPYLTKADMLAAVRREGIEPPRLYTLGFAHNNCGGWCVKGGHGHFANLLRTLPDRYAEHEAAEAELQVIVGGQHAIMRDRSGGETTPLSMRQFRLRIEAGHQPDLFDIAGCGCFVDEAEA